MNINKITLKDSHIPDCPEEFVMNEYISQTALYTSIWHPNHKQDTWYQHVFKCLKMAYNGHNNDAKMLDKRKEVRYID